MATLVNTTQLLTTWRSRSRDIMAQRLQDHSDMLYDHLRADILARTTTLQADLLKVAQTASSRQELHIPLWTFHSAYTAANPYELPISVQNRLNRLLRKRGYDWCIGLAPAWFDPEGIDLEDWTFRWTLGPVTVYKLVYYTDLLQRLALLFGNDFRVVPRVVAVKTLTSPTEVRVFKTELRLHYYPGGLPLGLRSKRDAVREKYRTYVTRTWGEDTPYLWTGLPDEPPGFSNRPATPLPPPPPVEPPVLARRTNGGGIHPPTGDESPIPMSEETRASWNAFVESVEARRRLDFSIHEYSGPDAFQRAARDSIASALDDSAPCHCGYHHPETE